MNSCRIILPFSKLVDCDTKPPADFLSAGDCIVAVFQGSNDEHIGIIQQ